MSNERKFYVYEHWRPDRDECFYVGKGMRNRAHKMISRNRFHSAIQGKLSRLGLCVEVRIVAGSLTEAEAFLLEVERIAMWRSDGADLANMTNGGEGPSGLAAWNKMPVTCLEDGCTFRCASDAALHYKISAGCMSQVCKGGRASAKGRHFVYGIKNWNEQKRRALIQKLKSERIINRKRVDCPQAYGDISRGLDVIGRSAAGPMKISRPVICVDDGHEFPSASAAARNYKLSKSAVIELCLGKNHRQTVGGRVFKYKDAE